MTTIPTFIAGLTLAASLFFASTAGALATEPPKSDAPKTEAPKAEPTKDQEKTVHVLMTTSMGDISIELNNEKAPISTQNFLSYVDKKFYDGTIFHRIVKDFMIQGGGFTPDQKQKATGQGIKNEWKNGLKNLKGTIAMARTRVADSGTSQFFINTKDNGFLDQPNDGAAYAVFGRVVGGMDIVEKLNAVAAKPGLISEAVPVEMVEIKSVRRMTPEEVAKVTGTGTEPAKDAPKK